MAICSVLNIAGALENTRHANVIKALERRNMAIPIRKWIEALLNTWIVETIIGRIKIRIGTTRDCPQGGILSPAKELGKRFLSELRG